MVKTSLFWVPKWLVRAECPFSHQQYINGLKANGIDDITYGKSAESEVQGALKNITHTSGVEKEEPAKKMRKNRER